MPRKERTKAFAGILLVLVTTFAAPASGQILLDAASSATANGPNLSWSHTIGAVSNRILVVGVSMRRNNRIVNSITYGGAPLTYAGTENSTNSVTRVEIWYLLAPPQGTANVVVTLTGSTAMIGGAASFSGVDQIAPVGPFVSLGGTGPVASLSVPNAVNELVVDVVAVPGTALSLTPGAGQGTLWDRGTGTSGNQAHGAGSRSEGAPSVALSWTLGVPADWAIAAITLKPTPIPNMVLTLAQDNSTPPPGTTVVYTINYTNNGNGPAGSALLAFSAPANTSLALDGVALNGTPKTDAADADEVTRSGSTVSVNLGGLPAGSTGTLTYKVVIQ